MTTTPPEQAPTATDTAAALETAQQAHTDAEQAVTTLQRAIVAGNTTITRMDLEDARAEARFTTLRLQAARDRHTATLAAAQDQAIERLRDAITVAYDPDGPLNHTAAPAALEKFQAAVIKAAGVYLHVLDRAASISADLVAQARAAGVPTFDSHADALDAAASGLHIVNGVLLDGAQIIARTETVSGTPQYRTRLERAAVDAARTGVGSYTRKAKR